MPLGTFQDTAPESTIPGTSLPMALQALTGDNSPLTLGPIATSQQGISAPVLPRPANAATQLQEGSVPSDKLMQAQKDPYKWYEVVLALLGGPGAANQLRGRYEQRMMGPVLADMGMKFHEALKQGNLDQAQALLGQFGQYAEITPLAFQAFQGFTTELNKQRDNIYQNKTIVDTFGPMSLAGSGAEMFTKIVKENPNRLPPQQVLDIYKQLGAQQQLRQGWRERIEGWTGNVLSSTTLPQGKTLETLTDTEKTVLPALGVNPSVYVDLYNKDVAGTQTVGEKAYWQQIQQGGQGQLGLNEALTNRNVALSVPMSEQGKSGATSRQAQRGAGLAVTRPTTQSQPGLQSQAPGSPQGFYKAEATMPTGQGVTLEFDSPQKLQDAVKVHKLTLTSPITWSQERTGIVGEARSTPPSTVSPLGQSTAPFSEPELGPQLAEQQTAIEGQRTHTVESARNTADTETKAHPEQVLWRMDASGKLESAANPTVALQRGGKWAQFAQPTQQSRDLTNIAAVQKPIRDFISVMEDSKIPASQKEGISNALGQWAAEGFRVPFTKFYPRIGGGRTLASPELYAQSVALSQAIEKAINPENADNRQIETVKSTLSGSMRTAQGAVATVKAIDKFLQSKAEGILGAQGAVEPKPSLGGKAPLSFTGKARRTP